MTAPRTSAAELIRALEAVTEPVYLLDGRRRIVFVNEACRRWLGERVDTALGRECRYQAIADGSGNVPAADLLCPPPEVLHGRRLTTEITLPNRATSEAAARRVEFIPLAGEGDEPAAVLAIVSLEAAAAVEATAADEEDPLHLHAALQRIVTARARRFALDWLVGSSAAMRRVRAQAALAAGSIAATLIVGPEGSGRRRLAYSLHAAGEHGGRGTLVPLACDLLTGDLLLAGIQAAKRGQTAPTGRTGTLLLENVDQLPGESQTALADVLRTAEPAFRIIGTATVMLTELAAAGEFQPDLAAALSTLVIELPALADRPEDLPLVAQRLLEEQNTAGGKQLSGFSPEALDALAAYLWPGDLDELGEFVAQAHAQAEGPLVQVRDLPTRLKLAADASRFARKPDEAIDLESFMGEIERELIVRALARARGNKAKAARLLGMTRPRLYRRLVQLGLEEPVIFEEQPSASRQQEPEQD